MTHRVLVYLAVLLIAVFAAIGCRQDGREGGQTAAAPATGDLQIEFSTQPSPPKGAAENKLFVTVRDSKGQPVRDANVKVTFFMPAMPEMNMPEMRQSADLTWDGSRYSGTANISMAGKWEVTVEVMKGGKTIGTHKTEVQAQ